MYKVVLPQGAVYPVRSVVSALLSGSHPDFYLSLPLSLFFSPTDFSIMLSLPPFLLLDISFVCIHVHTSKGHCDIEIGLMEGAHPRHRKYNIMSAHQNVVRDKHIKHNGMPVMEEFENQSSFMLPKFCENFWWLFGQIHSPTLPPLLSLLDRPSLPDTPSLSPDSISHSPSLSLQPPGWHQHNLKEILNFRYQTVDSITMATTFAGRHWIWKR